jgi:CheY-like chemotaxis protein
MVTAKDLNVLVVDDQESIREQLVHNLRSLGFIKIDECSNPNLALFKARQRHNQYQLIITDWCMPTYSAETVLSIKKKVFRDPELASLPLKSGEDLCRYIKQDPSLSDCKLVVASVCYQQTYSSIKQQMQKSVITPPKYADAVIPSNASLKSIGECLNLLFNLQLEPNAV